MDTSWFDDDADAAGAFQVLTFCVWLLHLRGTLLPPASPREREDSAEMETNASWGNCTAPQMSFQSTLYATTYTLIFIPGLLANSAALWVLCRVTSKKSKAVIFMINLAVADLAHLSPAASIALVTVAELFGFVIPFGTIACCTWKMRRSLRELPGQPPSTGEKRKALRMVLACAAVFFVCFAPHHLIRDCAVHRGALRFHPVSLCLASLNCCLDPVLYYFMTSEFQEQLLRCPGRRLRVRRRNLPRLKFWSLPKFLGGMNSMEIPAAPPDELLLESIS
ncbi:PREDICTED: putative P2Y purinoceptor 10 [Chaetura pelagica]|uniref:putative P2Y purinoceptor 10 n=1 Tax=Chaetura pelagica TaxID=8897 RepID=UPI000523DAA7|nr:PREDICTED: putative P2Y purinoceptor 10 [Chaetura pelagica]